MSSRSPLPRSAALFLLLTLAPALAHAAGAQSKAIDPANMDTSVQPGDDFFMYANGTWLKNNPIPPDQTEWGGFIQLRDHNLDVLHQILDATSAKSGLAKGSPEQLSGDLYASAMDSAQAEALGAKPLDDEMGRIKAIASTDALIDEFARLQTLSVRAPFGLGVNQDSKNSTQMMIQLGQSGLGLPDRDYYLKTDEASKKLRDQYVTHVTKTFALLGDSDADAAAHAQTVMTIETRLANASMTRVQRRDADATYHKMTIDTLQALTPAMSWARLYKGMDITDTNPVNVGQPAFFTELDKMIGDVPLADWQTYLRWHVVNSTATLLSSKFVDENFDFNGRILSGLKEQRPRWKRSVQLVDGEVGEALGQLYVAKAFTPEAKARAHQMIEDLRAELKSRIDGLTWMSAATKAQAQRKLAAFGVKIGYPDVWRSYSGLAVDRGSLLANVTRTREFEFRRNINKLGKPVDRNEWGMTPPTVNAYYNSRKNEIVFPAGILQPPFFDGKADDAVNYGGIGAVIGHEMTHGFDDQGRKFDADGNLKDWWTADDATQYLKRADMVRKQFDDIVAIDSLHINGKLTLGENLADLGGLNVAYGALQRRLKVKPQGKIDGFTPEQRFFLSWAQIWRENIRPESLKLQINTDPHSPGHYRANEPVSNMPEFAQAFGLKDGAPLVRPAAERAKIW
jgi:putative endopeptidase